jgi:hypothetical protein
LLRAGQIAQREPSLSRLQDRYRETGMVPFIRRDALQRENVLPCRLRVTNLVSMSELAIWRSSCGCQARSESRNLESRECQLTFNGNPLPYGCG